MADSPASGIASIYSHAITWPFKLAFWGGLSFLISWALAVTLACVFCSYVWQGSAGVSNLRFEAAYQAILNDAAAASFMASAEQVGGALLVHQCSEYAYKVVFVMSGLENVYFQALHGIAPEGIDGILFKAIRDHREGFEASMWGTRLFGAKLALVLTSLPLFIAAYAVAFVDGSVLRYIRTEGGGRESDYMYHRSKYTSVMLLGTSLTVILLLPLEFRPSFVLPLLAVCVGILGRIQRKYFKKYL
jgi:integrating conjugative element membrane protein (TIGR03747 family)